MNHDRYQRHSLIEWFCQDEIASKKICVIGAGAVGNEVIKNLSLLGVGTIHVFDFDKIEIHNLTRSVLFRESDIGKPKSQVACERAKELDPNLNIVDHYGDFWDELSISEIRNFDLVYCCVDNFEARLKLNKLCYLASVDFVNIGIDSRYASIEIFPYNQAEGVACYECGLPQTVYQRIATRYSCGWLKKVSFIEKKTPTTIITASMAASMAVSWGLRIGQADPKQTQNDHVSQKILVDTITGNTQKSTCPINLECPCCGMYYPASAIVKASPLISDRFFSDLEPEQGETTIWSSDPILTGYKISDSYDPEQFHVVFERASEFDDQFASTISKNPDSVLIEIRDQFDLKEFEEQFAGKKAPVKFFVMTNNESTIIIDLEENTNV